jgi:hypothetical protein
VKCSNRPWTDTSTVVYTLGIRQSIREVPINVNVPGRRRRNCRPLDLRRMGFLHPPTIRFLLEKGTLIDQAHCFQLTADLLSLNQSMSSKNPMDLNGTDVYDCKQIMKPVFLKTMYTEILTEEKPEQQLQHREASFRFLQACRASSKTQAKGKKERPIYPVGDSRGLLLTTASMKLRTFNQICTSIGKETLINSMAAFRENSFDG